ncbi:MAG: hypothetical protein B7X07_06715, partial [Actinobacteria bacterium 21-64-8]
MQTLVFCLLTSIYIGLATEKHEHEHVVIPMRGMGEAQAGCYVWSVGVGDVVYVSPSDPHQFRCPADAKEPFGFLCIVNSERDRPTAVDG